MKKGVRTPPSLMRQNHCGSDREVWNIKKYKVIKIKNLLKEKN